MSDFSPLLSVYAHGKPFIIARMLVVAIGLMVGLSGCAGRRHYTATTCPANLHAPPTLNAQTVDLSRFCGPPTNNERIGCGDVLEVSLAAGLDKDAISVFPIRVDTSGRALLPEIGHLPLAGLELAGAEQTIAAACVHRGLYRQPQVTVTMKHQRVNRITVVGAVKEPGIHEIPREASHLMAAIVAAGGLDEDAGTKVEIRRPVNRSRLAAGGTPPDANVQLASNTTEGGVRGVELVCLDLANTVVERSSDNYLDDGAVVRVERRNPESVQVIGMVRKPGQYDFPVNHELNVLGAIAMAGGMSQQLADKIYVIRNVPEDGGSAIVEVSLKGAKRDATENVRLAPGDVVSVEQTPLTVMMDVIHKVGFAFGSSVPMF